MKIRSLTSFSLSAPYVRPHSPPGHAANGTRNCVWVRIDTDAGISGWGEAYCGCYATGVTKEAIHRLGQCLPGMDALQTEATLAEMRFVNRYWAMRGIGAQCGSAIEAALLDIAGKVQQKAVWELLGDGERRPVMLYASAGETILSPEEISQEVNEYVHQGYRAYKMRCGGRFKDNIDSPDRDVERVAAARSALGPDRLLFVDVAVPQKAVNWGDGLNDRYMDALASFDIGFIEEPAMTYDVAEYRRLSDLKKIPVAGGELFSCPEEFTPFFEAGAYDVAQPDAAVVGGPASCVEVIRAAEKKQIPVAVHAWSAGIGIAQNLHAAWACSGVLAMEWPMSQHPIATEPLQDIYQFENGYLLPPSCHGLGVSQINELIDTYQSADGQERNF